MYKFKYLLSVVIPTKDRYEYLKECVSTILDINSDKIEVVVQDNTKENKEIVDFFKKVNNKNLKYFHSSLALSQTENSEKAIENSSGEYICFIGDDDSVAEIIVSLTEIMKENKIDSCNVNMSGYYWPDVVFKYSSKYSLSFDLRKAKVERINTKKILKNYLKSGMQEITLLPRLYHGILSRRALDKIKTLSGSYFPGPSPDMANATVAALVLNKHFFVKVPVVVSGTSFNSAAGKGLRGEHKGKLSSVSQLPKDIEKTWNKRIPKLWLGNTIWPETSIKSLENSKAYEFIEIFNFYSMYARIWLKHKEYRVVLKEYILSPKDYLLTTFAASKEITKWLFKRFSIKMRKFLGLEYIYMNDMSLTEACKITNNHNEKRNNIKIIKRELERLNKKENM
jgi:glycosyltransferase involved in cell wall biosynthesis